jgi:hypothetical protein
MLVLERLLMSGKPWTKKEQPLWSSRFRQNPMASYLKLS